MTLVTAVTATGVMLLLLLPETDDHSAVSTNHRQQDDSTRIYKSVTYHTDVEVKEEFIEIDTTGDFHSSSQLLSSSSSNKSKNSPINATDLPAQPVSLINEPVKLQLQPAGSLNMNAQGHGQALQVSLSITNGKFKIDQCTSIPKSVLSRREVKAANHLVVFKDSNEEELLAQAVQFHKLRAPLPEHRTRGSIIQDPNYEEYNAVMSFVKFPQKAKFVEIYSFEHAYIPERSRTSIRQFIRNSGQKLNLTHKGELK